MIHKFKLNNYNILVDVNSGAIHEIDDLAFEALDYLNEKSFLSKNYVSAIKNLENNYKINEICETCDELQELFQNGLLFSDEKFSNPLKINENVPIKSMCLSVAHDCNLSCAYCFAQNGSFGCEKSLMSEIIAKKAIDFLIKNSAERRSLEVDFFGGEPLLNFDVVKKTVEYARNLEKKTNKIFRFTVTTNALLLNNEKIDFINREFHNVVLSLDGRKFVNDKFRKTKAGKPSYDVVAPKIQNFIKFRGNKDYCVRGTFTKFNLDFSKDVMHFYNDLNIDNISIEPVICDEFLDYSITSAQLDKIFSEYEKLAKIIIKLKKNNGNIKFFRFEIDLDKTSCYSKKLKSCGCGTEYIAVTPEGNLYPCHQFIGHKKWILGNLNNNSFNSALKKEFMRCNLLTKPKCKDCWAKFFCCGGCNANNWIYNKNIFEVHEISCKLEKRRIECALMVSAALASNNYSASHKRDS